MKILILGAGNMGKWFAEKLSEKNVVWIYDVKREKIQNLTGVNFLTSLREISKVQPEMVLNAVTLTYTVKAFQDIEEFLPEKCLLVDIASIKGRLIEYYRQSKRPFVSIHPMFGPTSFSKDLKKEGVIIIKESDKKGAEFFIRFFTGLGLTVFEVPFVEHDKLMAYSLTLPFISTLIFSSCVKEESVPGTTFKKHLLLAKELLNEDSHLLTEVLLNPHSVEQLRVIISRLEYLRLAIEEKDFESIMEFVENLKKRLQ